MKRRRIVWLGCSILLLLVIAGAVSVSLHPEILHRPNWFSYEIGRRTLLMGPLANAMRQYVELHGGQVPDSVETLIITSPQLSDPEVLKRDYNGNRILNRAKILQNIQDSSGARYTWMIAVLVPQGGFLDALHADYLCVESNPDTGGGTRTIEEARRFYGSQVVEAAYQRYRDDVAGAATREAAQQQ